LKAAYVLRKIAEKERIIVTESEVDSQIRAFAARQGWREERARSYMEERGMVRALRDDMRESKATDFLVENAEVTEIPPEEFAKRHGAEGPADASGEED
jgi:FKBP-type peptidyl-prolyl cis-trans isomerase (trigger factor)